MLTYMYLDADSGNIDPQADVQDVHIVQEIPEHVDASKLVIEDNGAAFRLKNWRKNIPITGSNCE